jgi:hypothetical protein
MTNTSFFESSFLIGFVPDYEIWEGKNLLGVVTKYANCYFVDSVK